MSNIQICFCLALSFVIGVDGHAARREFLSYALSLMRAHNSEHLDSLPIMDVSALKHIAYVFDALIYYMKSGTDPPDVDILRDGLPSSAWNDQVWYRSYLLGIHSRVFAPVSLVTQ